MRRWRKVRLPGSAPGASDGETMSAAIEEFLDKLASNPGVHGLARVTGTVRFDLVADGVTEHRFVTISLGRITVSADDGPADCVIRGDRALLDGAARGERNLTSAWLRSALVVNGRVELFRLLERLFPASVTGHDPRHLAPGFRPERRRG